STLLEVASGAAIAALSGLFPVRIPGTKTSLAGAELFIFLLLLVHGPAAATIAAAAEAAVGSLRTSKRWTSRIGSPTMAAMAMYGCGAAFSLATTAARNQGALSNSWLLVALFTFAIGYFACSTLLLSPEGRIVQANDALAALLGRTTAECTGIKLWQLAHPDDADSLQAAMRRMLDGVLSPRTTEHRFQHATGHPVWLLLNPSPFGDGLSIMVTASADPSARRPPATA